jgi:hypothetical protein
MSRKNSMSTDNTESVLVSPSTPPLEFEYQSLPDEPPEGKQNSRTTISANISMQNIQEFSSQPATPPSSTIKSNGSNRRRARSFDATTQIPPTLQQNGIPGETKINGQLPRTYFDPERLRALKAHRVNLLERQQGGDDSQQLVLDIADNEKQIREIEQRQQEQKLVEATPRELKYGNHGPIPENLSFTSSPIVSRPYPINGDEKRITFSGMPRNYVQTDFEIRRRAKIRTEIEQHFTTLRSRLTNSNVPAYKYAEVTINWDASVASATVALCTIGKYWDKPKRQKFLVEFGWWVLKLAQLTELFYTAGGIFLSFLKEPVTSPLFWMGFIPTFLASPGTLIMNVALVNPDNEVKEVICPDELALTLESFQEGREIKFQHPLMNDSKLGFANEFAAEFFNDCLINLAAKQPEKILNSYQKFLRRSLKLFTTPAEWLVKFLIEATFHLSNAIAPSGNWLAIPFLVGFIASWKGSSLSAWQMVVVGTISSIFVTAVDAGYYVALGQGPKNQALENACTSRNPVIQAFKIEWVSALRGLYEYIKNAILRGVSVAGCVSAAIEYLYLNKLIDDGTLNDGKRYSELVVFLTIFVNTIATRHRAFRDIILPCTFTMPTGHKQVITKSQALDYAKVRTKVRSEYSADDMSKLIGKSISYGIADAIFVGILAIYNYGDLPGLPTTGGTFVLASLLCYYSSKKNLINRRSRDVLDILSGIAAQLKIFTSQEISLIIGVVFSDAVARAISRIGGLRGFLSDLEVGDLGVSDMAMYFAFLAFTIPAAIPEASFFKYLMEMNAPLIIRWTQDNLEDKHPDEKLGCWKRSHQRLNQLTANILTTFLPAWFKKEGAPGCLPKESNWLSFILPCCFRRKKPMDVKPRTAPSMDMKSINTSSSEPVISSQDHGISSEPLLGRRDHNISVFEESKTARIYAAIRQVKEKERQELCMVM